MIFEWDVKKEKVNLKKHGISFSEASTVFYREDSLITYDPDHSESEDRFIIIGFSTLANALIVCFCDRSLESELVRIISARKLTKKEKKHFKGGS